MTAGSSSANSIRCKHNVISFPEKYLLTSLVTLELKTQLVQLLRNCLDLIFLHFSPALQAVLGSGDMRWLHAELLQLHSSSIIVKSEAFLRPYFRCLCAGAYTSHLGL